MKKSACRRKAIRSRRRRSLRSKAWIESGAHWPENATDKAALADKRLQHWAWQPLTKFSTPQSIDSIIHAKLVENKLTFTRSRSPHAHPTPQLRSARPSSDTSRSQAFIQDKDPKAYEKLIDRLLASQRYGERYARHWLDIAHYADTHGFERDQRRDNAWRYRDYVINALNADKPTTSSSASRSRVMSFRQKTRKPSLRPVFSPQGPGISSGRSKRRAMCCAAAPARSISTTWSRRS
jgi:hypothetical protein